MGNALVEKGRRFPGGTPGVLLACWVVFMFSSWAQPVPVALTMDLYHPPCDPDDHWDLLTLVALREAGRINLLGVVIDYPLPIGENGRRPVDAGEPAAVTLAQARRLTGRDIPWVVGAARPYSDVMTSQNSGSQMPEGAAFLLDVLRHSPEPVVLVVTGSCRDVAIAAGIDQDLFARRCRALYLNAGVAFHEGQDAGTEWNVDLDLPAWRAVWDLPCPIYWLPCFERPGQFQIRPHGSWWKFRQGDILPELRPAWRNLLLFALLRQDASRWITALDTPPDAAVLQTQSDSDRNMWCTAGFFHMAGWAVRRDGSWADHITGDEEPLFDFIPIETRKTGENPLTWELASEGTGNRFILRIRDTAAYTSGMTTVLRTLLKEYLPDRRSAADRPAK